MSRGLATPRSVFGLTHFDGSFSAKQIRRDCHSKYSLGEYFATLLLHSKEPLHVLRYTGHREGLYCIIRCLTIPCSCRERMLIPEYLHLFKTWPVHYETELSKQTVRNITKNIYFVPNTQAGFPAGYYHFDNLRL